MFCGGCQLRVNAGKRAVYQPDVVLRRRHARGRHRPCISGCPCLAQRGSKPVDTRLCRRQFSSLLFEVLYALLRRPCIFLGCILGKQQFQVVPGPVVANGISCKTASQKWDNILVGIPRCIEWGNVGDQRKFLPVQTSSPILLHCRTKIFPRRRGVLHVRLDGANHSEV